MPPEWPRCMPKSFLLPYSTVQLQEIVLILSKYILALFLGRRSVRYHLRYHLGLEGKQLLVTSTGAFSYKYRYKFMHAKM